MLQIVTLISLLIVKSILINYFTRSLFQFHGLYNTVVTKESIFLCLIESTVEKEVFNQ